MIRVAAYSARGPFRGRVQILRAVSGAQRWTVKVKIRRDDAIDEHTIRPSAPCHLREIEAVVFQSIREMLPDGNLVDDADMEFFITKKRRRSASK